MVHGNPGLSMAGGLASLAGALLLVWVLADPLGGGWRFTVAGIAGLAGAVLGIVSRRSGANGWNSIGLYLGLAVVACWVLLFLWLTPGEMTTTEVTNVD